MTWINHVKKYAKDNNCSYKEALSKASKTYTKAHGGRGAIFSKRKVNRLNNLPPELREKIGSYLSARDKAKTNATQRVMFQDVNDPLARNIRLDANLLKEIKGERVVLRKIIADKKIDLENWNYLITNERYREQTLNDPESMEIHRNIIASIRRDEEQLQILDEVYEDHKRDLKELEDSEIIGNGNIIASINEDNRRTNEAIIRDVERARRRIEAQQQAQRRAEQRRRASTVIRNNTPENSISRQN